MDILKRLEGYNPPDRTTDDQRQIAVDIQDARSEVERLRSVLAKARDQLHYVSKKSNFHIDEDLFVEMDACLPRSTAL